MTPAQKIMVTLSECRQRLNVLLGVEDRSSEQNAEMEKLTAAVSKREPELRAALAAEPDPREVTTATGDPEQRERLELRAKSSVVSYVQAALEMRSLDGPEAEFNSALKMGSHQFPLEMLAPEERQTTAVDVSANQGNWLDRLFNGFRRSVFGRDVPGRPGWRFIAAGDLRRRNCRTA